MKEEEFKKGIDELENIRMTDEEKARMLERVFAAPIRSPYMRKRSPFSFLYLKYTRASYAAALVLVLVLSFGGMTYGSESALPGDFLYPIKTKVLETMIDAINSAPEKRVVWEIKKVARRIAEAEMLVERNELDDKKLESLKHGIEESSMAFVTAVNTLASSTVASTPIVEDKVETLKQEFRKQVNERKEVIDHKQVMMMTIESVEDDEMGESNQAEPLKQDDKLEKAVEREMEKIDELKATAIKVLEEEVKVQPDPTENVINGILGN